MKMQLDLATSFRSIKASTVAYTWSKNSVKCSFYSFYLFNFKDKRYLSFLDGQDYLQRHDCMHCL